MKTQRPLLLHVLAAGIALAGGGAHAQTTAPGAYPAKLVRVVVPTAAGGGSDLQARLVAKHFQEAFGHPFVVENRPGASGSIGAEIVAKAPPPTSTRQPSRTGFCYMFQATPDSSL